LVVVGAGAVGVEFAYFFNAVGSRVTVLEMLPSLLPGEDAEISRLLERSFKKQGIEVHTSARVKSIDLGEGGREAPCGGERAPGKRAILGEENEGKGALPEGPACVHVETGGGPKSLSASKVLMAIGVAPNSAGLGLEDIGVDLDKEGFVEVDEHMRTSAEGVYAIGDVTGPPMLAHVASAQGILAVETIAGLSPKPHSPDSMPRCVYCQPQVASVGLSEEKAAEWAGREGRKIKVGRFPFRASGKSVAIGEREGIVKILADAESGRILGAAIIGSEATELLAETGLALELGASAERLLNTVHAHPTLSESVMEAAGDAMGMAIHKPADALGGGR
jgi:dihydrolipoamide dehydrogenase